MKDDTFILSKPHFIRNGRKGESVKHSQNLFVVFALYDFLMAVIIKPACGETDAACAGAGNGVYCRKRLMQEGLP